MVEINSLAPKFKAKALIDGKEEEISLDKFKGKKVAIYFYPKDLTPGCTIQAENLRDGYEKLKENNIVVLGVSVDSMKSHERFAEKKGLPFILVSDEDKQLVEKYGVWQQKSMFGKKYMGTVRKTFLIDEKGKIIKIIEKPTVGKHTDEILKGFQE